MATRVLGQSRPQHPPRPPLPPPPPKAARRFYLGDWEDEPDRLAAAGKVQCVECPPDGWEAALWVDHPSECVARSPPLGGKYEYEVATDLDEFVYHIRPDGGEPYYLRQVEVRVYHDWYPGDWGEDPDLVAVSGFGERVTEAEAVALADRHGRNARVAPPLRDAIRRRWAEAGHEGPWPFADTPTLEPLPPNPSPLRIADGWVEGAQPDGSYARLESADSRPLTAAMLDTLHALIASHVGRTPPAYRPGNPYDALDKALKRVPALTPYIVRPGPRRPGERPGRVRLRNPHAGGHSG